MKRIVVLMLCVVLTAACFPVGSLAESQPEEPYLGEIVSETIEYLEDGTQIVTTVYDNTPTQNDGIATAATTLTKSGSKVTRGIDSDGEVLWTLTVNGTFTVVTGSSATCTAASYSYTTPGSGWSLKTGSATKSANKAIANGTFVKKLLGITLKTQEASVTLTCSVNGTLS